MTFKAKETNKSPNQTHIFIVAKKFDDEILQMFPNSEQACKCLNFDTNSEFIKCGFMINGEIIALNKKCKNVVRIG